MPSLHRQAVNAATAGLRIADALMHGEQVKAAQETIDARRAMCLSCEKCFTSDPHENGKTYHRCQICGCWLDGEVFAKLTLTTETCPLGKWV